MRQLLVMLLCCGTALMAGAPAVADTRIGLSNDGKTWASGLPAPLFDPAVRWVPGDQRTASFFVRNQADSAAGLTISARSRDTGRLLSNDDISLAARAEGGAWHSLANHRATTSLTRRALAVGSAVKVEVRAVFDAASTNQSQVKSVALRFVVTLADAAGTRPSHHSSAHSADGLPGTGSPVRPWMVWLGAIMVGCGWALARRRGAEAR